MNVVSAFFMRNIVFVYFFYGLAFFAMGLVVILESTRASEFRFARALRPLAAFGVLHGMHEWFEMFQIFAAHEGGRGSGTLEEVTRIALLAVSFLCLLAFGMRLLPDAERRPHLTTWRVALVTLAWLVGVALVQQVYAPPTTELLAAADVLARYSLGIPSAFLATWALLRERHDFHARGMSPYGKDLLWAALAFFVYGVFGQFFTRPSLLFPSQWINTALFLRTFGIPVQLLRGLGAIAIAITLGRALRAFELESRLRLALANRERLEAQASALEAQARRVEETEGLNQQLSTTARELSALVQMSRILSSTIDLKRLLQDSLYQIVYSFESACCSVIFLKRPDGGLELAAKYRRPHAPVPISLPPITQAMADAFDAERPAAAGLSGPIHVLETGRPVEGSTYRTLAVPLHAKDQLFGGIVLTSLREEEPFGQREVDLLMAFGQQLASSVENAGLYQMLQQRETRLEEMLRQLVNAQESERQRIARELHDDTGQKLTALAMGLAAVETALPEDRERAGLLVRDLRELAGDSITELRHIMSDLRPPQLDDLGLVPALKWYVQSFRGRHPEIDVQLAADRPAQRLPAQYETVLFRVAQEALSNVARHAHAQHVEMRLQQAPDQICLSVRDDGVGFDMAQEYDLQAGSGWGLMGMRERAALIGGTCTIESEPGRGTRVIVEIPLN